MNRLHNITLTYSLPDPLAANIISTYHGTGIKSAHHWRSHLEPCRYYYSSVTSRLFNTNSELVERLLPVYCSLFNPARNCQVHVVHPTLSTCRFALWDLQSLLLLYLDQRLSHAASSSDEVPQVRSLLQAPWDQKIQASPYQEVQTVGFTLWVRVLWVAVSGQWKCSTSRSSH